MILIPWKRRETWLDPLNEGDPFQQELNRFFQGALTRWPEFGFGLSAGAWSPAVDVYESKDTLVVKADLPGLTKDDIEVSVHGDTLTIKGEKKEDREVKEHGLLRTERFSGGFYRAITLPDDVDTENIKAAYTNGVLELTLPKREEAKPKHITIDASAH